MTTPLTQAVSPTSYSGHVAEFNHATSEFYIFKNKLKNFFSINRVTNDEELKRAFFLNALTENTYKLLESLCIPSKPENKSFSDLIKLLEDHLTPVRSYFAAKIAFYGARQMDAESIADWMVRLQSLATPCGFDAVNLKAALRDIFVVGMKPGPIKDRLLEEDGTTCELVKLKEIALAKESSMKEKLSLASGSTAEVYHAQVKDKKNCRVCGKNNHKSVDCKFKNYNCNFYNKKMNWKSMGFNPMTSKIS